jgi:hypothetical protein
MSQKSKVYFARLNSSPDPVAGALNRIISRSGLFTESGSGKFFPIKITLGDGDCVFNVRPEWIKAIVSDFLKKGYKPFLFDTGVIYKGSRQNAVDHMNLAEKKGFSASLTGAPFIVADGLFGYDGIEEKINSPQISSAKFPSFYTMVDRVLVVSHVTGHIVSGYAGAVKNVAMGMACKATKQVEHSSLKPSVLWEKCTACGLCAKICPVLAIEMVSSKARIDGDKCVGCGECLCACKFDAIKVNWEEDVTVFLKRMADVCGAILGKFKEKYFINFAVNITKECDCISDSSEPLISEDVGVLASVDPVSIDRATADIINGNKDVFAESQGHDKYHQMLDYAGEKAIGNPDYELVEL